MDHDAYVEGPIWDEDEVSYFDLKDLIGKTVTIRSSTDNGYESIVAIDQSGNMYILWSGDSRE